MNKEQTPYIRHLVDKRIELAEYSAQNRKNWRDALADIEKEEDSKHVQWTMVNNKWVKNNDD